MSTPWSTCVPGQVFRLKRCRPLQCIIQRFSAYFPFKLNNGATSARCQVLLFAPQCTSKRFDFPKSYEENITERFPIGTIIYVSLVYCLIPIIIDRDLQSLITILERGVLGRKQLQQKSKLKQTALSQNRKQCLYSSHHIFGKSKGSWSKLRDGQYTVYDRSFLRK